MSTDSPLFSSNWYRVGPLLPRIQPGTRIHRHVLRGEEWFLFTHPVTGHHHRLNRKAYELAGRLDGEHSLDVLWNGLQSSLGDAAPTQDEVIAMLAQMTDAGLVQFDTLPDWDAFRAQQQVRQSREQRNNLNPFSFRIRLFDPSDLVQRLSFLQPVLWHPLTGAALVILLVWALFQAIVDWSAISAYASVHLLTPRSLLLAWVLYPPLKALHELAHALVVQHYGGEVKEAGIGFLVLMPAPYVDASAAIALPDKWQRAVVSSAGIIVELLLAALALMVWGAVENGLVRDIAFAVMVIGGVSTLVFNANPLLRFDGYYILCDVLELPNLASRSQRWWMERLQQFMRGTQQSSRLATTAGERPWLFLYTPASWIYRVLISLVIVMWLADFSAFLGFLTMVWLAFVLFAKPLWTVLSTLFASAHPGQPQWKQRLVGTSLIAAVLVGLLAVPLPASTVASGVVWLPEHALVRTDSDSRVQHVLVESGQSVKKGQALVETEEPALIARRSRLLAELQAAETENASGWMYGSVRGRNANEDMSRLARDLNQTEEKINHLTLRAGVDGVFVRPRSEELASMHLLKGTLVAYVLPSDPTLVRVVIGHDDIGRLQEGIDQISVRLAESGNHSFPARLHRIDPAATNYLPSKVMGDKAGGTFVTDPADPEGLRVLEPVFLIDVQLPERNAMRAGGRAWVKFEHPPQPLAQALLWRFKQLFLRTFAWEVA